MKLVDAIPRARDLTSSSYHWGSEQPHPVGYRLTLYRLTLYRLTLYRLTLYRLTLWVIQETAHNQSYVLNAPTAAGCRCGDVMADLQHRGTIQPRPMMHCCPGRGGRGRRPPSCQLLLRTSSYIHSPSVQ